MNSDVRRLPLIAMPLLGNKFLVVALVMLTTTLVGQAQTSAQLRAKYGDPQMTELRDNHPSVERFLVRRDIQMTIRYTDLGEPWEALFEPVPDSTPKTGRPEHAPNGDYMSTAELITVINEVLPVEKRGKKGKEFFVNGGDREMKLHHSGCTGYYSVEFENASVSAASWCWGGTFSATIHWVKTTYPFQIIKPKTNNAPLNKSERRERVSHHHWSGAAAR